MNPSAEATLLAVWITFTVLALIALTAVLVWAARSRQFSNQERARYLALESRIPEPTEAPVRQASSPPGGNDA